MCRALLYLGQPVLLEPEEPRREGARRSSKACHGRSRTTATSSSEKDVFAAIERTLGILRRAREALDITLSSSVSLFITSGSRLAAVRYCFELVVGARDRAQQAPVGRVLQADRRS